MLTILPIFSMKKISYNFYFISFQPVFATARPVFFTVNILKIFSRCIEFLTCFFRLCFFLFSELSTTRRKNAFPNSPFTRYHSTYFRSVVLSPRTPEISFFDLCWKLLAPMTRNSGFTDVLKLDWTLICLLIIPAQSGRSFQKCLSIYLQYRPLSE